MGGADDGVVRYPSSPFPPLCFVAKSLKTPPLVFIQRERETERGNVRVTPAFSVNISSLPPSSSSPSSSRPPHGGRKRTLSTL